MSTNVQVNVVSADMEENKIKTKGGGNFKEPSVDECLVIHVETGEKRNSTIYRKDGQVVAELKGRDGQEK